MKRSEAIFGILRIPLDALAVAAALLLSYRLRAANIDLIPGLQLLETATTLPPLEMYLQTFVLPSLAVFFGICMVLGLYVLQTTRSAWREMSKVLIAAVIWLMLVIAWFFLVQKQLFYSRILLVHAAVLLAFFVIAIRTAILLLQRALLRNGIGVRLVASIGRQTIARNAREVLIHDVRYEYLGHMPDLSALKILQQKCVIDLVLQTDPDPQSRETIQLIEYCRSHHIGYGFLPPVLADVPHQLRVERLDLMPIVRFQPTPLDGWGRIFKGAFDAVGSAVLLIILSPLLLGLALLVYATSGWPIFYVSRRVGEHGRTEIPVLKFRSMVRDADARKQEFLAQNERRDGPLFKLRHDPRVTPIGRVLRRLDLDELPQLLNVLVGHMSLVGPRPHLPEEVQRYKPYERRVFAVRPGMTGLAQVSGRSDLSFKEEVRLDLQYVGEWSVLLDLWILWRTLVAVLRRRRTE